MSCHPGGVLFLHILEMEKNITDSIPQTTPGVATQKLLDYGWIQSLWLRTFFLSPSQGAFTSLFCLTSPLVKEQAAVYRGAYLVPFGRVVPPVPKARDVALQRKLWELSEEIVGEVRGLRA